MYYDIRGKQGFQRGELIGLRGARDAAIASAAYANAAWSRAEAESQRVCYRDDESAAHQAHATRERARVAHREAMALRDEVAELEYEMGEDDEYGYAA